MYSLHLFSDIEKRLSYQSTDLSPKCYQNNSINSFTMNFATFFQRPRRQVYSLINHMPAEVHVYSIVFHLFKLSTKFDNL